MRFGLMPFLLIWSKLKIEPHNHIELWTQLKNGVISRNFSERAHSH